MRCAWQELLGVLPIWMRERTDVLGRGRLQELRMRLDRPPELIMGSEVHRLEKPITPGDISFVINTASRYSPWAAETISQGFLTVAGGHRIGICGECVIDQGQLKGFRQVTSLCIRVARDIRGIADTLPSEGSILIIGSPGTGKTTLLRDLIRQRSANGVSSIAVVDERGEIFPKGFEQGNHTDVLNGCSKPQGISMALRTMGPGTIAVDEITDQLDADALQQALWCGVDILATAHAASCEDLHSRAVYRTLLESGLFQTLVILQPDKSWRTERISL